MIATRDTAEHAGWLALTTGREKHDFFWRQAVDLAQLNEAPLRDVHESQLARDLQVLLHAAADDGRLAAQLVCRSHDFTQATDVGSKGRYQHPTWRLVNQQ